MPDPHLPSPEVIREFSDRGTLWLLEDPANLRDLVRIVAPELADRLDFAQAQRINRSLIPADLQKRESDLIFSVPFRGAPGQPRPKVWVYILLEHQSKPDPLMPLRLLFSMVQLWESQRRDWETRRTPQHRRRLRVVIPLVFYTGRRVWQTPLRLATLFDVPAELERFVPTWETLFLNLHRTSAAMLTRFSSAVGQALRVLQEERAPKEKLRQVLVEVMADLEELPGEHAAQWLEVVWYFTLVLFHRRKEPEYTELEPLVRESARRSKFHLKEEVEQLGKTMAQLVEERGRAQGREEGRAEGEARGRAEGEARGRAEGEALGLRGALQTALETRFGAISPRVRAALATADLDTLDGWFRRALTAESMEEVGIVPQEPHR